MTEKIHDDVERALEAFGGVKFSYHTFGRFVIQPRLWVTAEKNPPPLDLPPMDEEQASDGQPRYEMDAPTVRLADPAFAAVSAPPAAEPPAVPLSGPPPRRELTWADPETVAPPPSRPLPAAAPPAEPETWEIDPMPVFGRAPNGGPPPAPGPAYEADLDPEPMPAFGRMPVAPPPPAEAPALATEATFADPPLAGEALFFPETTSTVEAAPEPEPWPEPLPTAPLVAPVQAVPVAVAPVAVAPVAAAPLAAAPVVAPPVEPPPVPVPQPPPAVPASMPTLFATPLPGDSAANGTPPSNLLTLAALSNAWHAPPVAPAAEPAAEPKAPAPVAAVPPPVPPEAAVPAPLVEPAGELNIFQLAWSRAAVAPDSAETADTTADADNVPATNRAGPQAAVLDAPMPSERDLFRRI